MAPCPQPHRLTLSFALLAACGRGEPVSLDEEIALSVEDVEPVLAPPGEGLLRDTGASEEGEVEPGTSAADGGEDSVAAEIIAAVLTPSEERRREYEALVPKDVVALQMFRELRVASEGEGGRPRASLLDLNPVVHEWFVLDLVRGETTVRYHLENHEPRRVRLRAGTEYADGVVLEVDGQERRCALWTPGEPSALELARTSGRAFAPLCEGRLSLRNPVDGRRSNLEVTTDFLRDNVWGGEQITALVRETVYQDSELVTSDLVAGREEAEREEGPRRFQVDPALAGRRLRPVNLGLPLTGAGDGTLEIGRWYALDGYEGVFASAVQPVLADPALFTDWKGRVHPLDEVEGTALVYVVAFDLAQHELRFDTGTDHPRVGWSERARKEVVDSRLPGPDGFGSLTPLVRNGKVNPAQVSRLVSTFTGGFKRSHGAFKAGERALQSSGTHYGWVEHGVVESKLHVGLATAVGWADGSVEVKVWGPEDQARLAQVRWARQNGVPLLQTDPETGQRRPGDLVTAWTAGNWSGSAEGKLRSVRASLCVQDSERGRYLLYAYFSSATPSSMARVLAAYGCDTGMLTDMNALEHTYLSLHRFREGVYDVHHLVTGMHVLDKEQGGVYLPRFVGLADNRDFFTVLRRTPGGNP